MFYKLNEENNAVLFHNCGAVVTKLDANVYPIGSHINARYRHPNGIVLALSDARHLGIKPERLLYKGMKSTTIKDSINWMQARLNRDRVTLRMIKPTNKANSRGHLWQFVCNDTGVIVINECTLDEAINYLDSGYFAAKLDLVRFVNKMAKTWEKV